MSCCCFSTYLLAFVAIIVGFGYKKYRSWSKSLPRPHIDEQFFWGRGDGKDYKEDTAIKPFKVEITQKVIDRLKGKLDDSPKAEEPLEGVGFQYGFNGHKLDQVVDYWSNTYLKKWSERQDFLNQYPQFKTQIQGLDIHFIHAKPKSTPAGTKVYQILLLHGWPGSVREFYEIIQLLTTPKDNIVFEVIAPSLPGYGWSQGASKKKFGPVQIAVVLRNLMLRIGFTQFYIQGGDWGSVVGNGITTFFPENVLGYHCNMAQIRTPLSTIRTIIASFYPSYFIEKKYVSWMYPQIPKLKTLIAESGYFHIQATKPDTIGAALRDNPVGLAAYILEKFSTATDLEYRKLDDGGLEKDFTMDALLDNVMIYYLSNAMTTAVRLYSEAFGGLEYALSRVHTHVPFACARFKNEIMHQFDWIIEEKYRNLVQSNHFDHGGHFAALQLPNILYNDVLDFVKKTLR